MGNTCSPSLALLQGALELAASLDACEIGGGGGGRAVGTVQIWGGIYSRKLHILKYIDLKKLSTTYRIQC